MRGRVLVAVLALALVACGEEQVIAAGQTATSAGARAQPDADAPSEAAGAGARKELTDEHFVEADVRNRDPFRAYADHFRPEAPTEVQRRVTMPDVAIDQMHMVAIITRLPQPKAMLVDPAGVGHVVERGDYIGRAEVVQTGGPEGMPVTLNWRVDRIRRNELVLSREDPTDPDHPPLRRVLALYDEDELVMSRTFN